MKKTMYLLCAVTLVLAVLSISAFADVFTPDASGVYTVTKTVAAYANKQVTIVVYSGSSATVSTIQYIDQQTANASGKYEFKFKLKDAPTATLQVKVGAETRTAAQSLGTIEPPAPPASVTLTGKISFYGPKSTLTFKAKNLSTNKETTISAVTKSEDSAAFGTYSVTLPSGNYLITAAQPFHASYTKNSLAVITAGQTFDVALLGGWIFPDSPSIDIDCLIRLLGSYKKKGAPGFTSADINWSGQVDIDDLIILLGNYKKKNIVVL